MRRTRLFIKKFKSIGVVDAGANAEAGIVLFKRDATASTEEEGMETVRTMVSKRIGELAVAFRQANPKLTDAQARDEAYQTEEGRKLSALARDRDSVLSPTEFAAKKAEDYAATVSRAALRGQLETLAQKRSAEKGEPLASARLAIIAERPELLG